MFHDALFGEPESCLEGLCLDRDLGLDRERELERVEERRLLDAFVGVCIIARVNKH